MQLGICVSDVLVVVAVVVVNMGWWVSVCVGGVFWLMIEKRRRKGVFFF